MSYIVIKPGLGYLDRLYSEKIVVPTLSYWKHGNYTPNWLTTFGNIVGINCLFWWNYYSLHYVAIYCLWVRYYFDCADGLMARQFKMTSDFGDWYDHISDWTFGVGFALTLYAKFKGFAFIWALLAYMFATILFAAQLAGVEEKNKGDWDHNYMLAITIPLFPFNKKYIQFADGVFYYTVQMLLIWYS